MDIGETPPSRWLAEHAQAGARIGYDPWVHTPAQIERFTKALGGKNISLVALEHNPIDAIWTDRPAPPLGQISPYPPRYAGASVNAKLARIRKTLHGADALFLSDPHSIAWAFNIRGADIAHTPIALAFALLPASGRPTLYVEAEKISQKTRGALEKFTDIAPPSQLLPDLRDAGAKAQTILFDAATAPVKLVETLRAAGGEPRLGDDPVALPKAIKNETELAGARAAHVRDGAALTRFLAWFETEALTGGLTEIAAAQALETFRREGGLLRDISFPTISAFGPHAAIPHYRVSDASNLRIGRGVYLVDSGAQYLDGTTDVTRTVVVGRASKQLRDHFTRVLKGHIAIARAVFPRGVSGAQLDGFARRYLWEAGLDFDHGVGHGVGAYLSVHEGPQRISKFGTTALEPGMILSNEPGYYRAGEYGIRLENLVIVEPREIKGAEREMRGFETITLAPFDLNCVEPELSLGGRSRLARRLSRARAQDAVAAARRQDAPLAEDGDAQGGDVRFFGRRRDKRSWIDSVRSKSRDISCRSHRPVALFSPASAPLSFRFQPWESPRRGFWRRGPAKRDSCRSPRRPRIFSASTTPPIARRAPFRRPMARCCATSRARRCPLVSSTRPICR